MSQQVNDIKKMLEQTMTGITGLLKVATDRIEQAKKDAVTEDQKKEFAEQFVKSGALREFNELTEKFKQI